MTTADLIAALGIFIALIALGATFYQAYISRDHNRRSVRPALVIHIDNIANSGYYLQNCGTGPAFISAIEYFIDDKTVPDIESFKKEIVGIGTDLGIKAEATTCDPEQPIGIGERSFQLVRFIADDPAVRTRMYERIRLVVRYKSIYGEEFSVVSPK